MRRMAVLLLALITLLPACRTPGAGSGSELPPQPGTGSGVLRAAAIYFSADPPTLRDATGVERVASMADLKGLTGDSPRAIWLDAAIQQQVDPVWLREHFDQQWPVFVFGPEAHRVLMELLSINAEELQPGMGVYRQRSPIQGSVEGLWATLPAADEALRVSEALISEGEAKLETVDLGKAPTPVREFAGKLGRVEIAQTLKLRGETYLFITGGWQATSARKELGAVRVQVAKKAGAASPGVWRVAAGSAPIHVESRDPYLPQVVNLHHLPEVPITGNATVVTPAPGARGDGNFKVTGYVRAFEATFHVRVKDPTGKVLTSKWATTAIGGPDWGSFAIDLPYSGAGSGTLEVFVQSMKDGSEIILSAIPVEL